MKNSQITNNPQEEKNVDVALWLRFLQEQRVAQSFEAIRDPRQQSKSQYPLSSLVMWALSVPGFRQASKNEFQTTLESLSDDDKEGITALLGCQGKKLPHSSTVDHTLAKVDYEEVNEILIKQMDKLVKKKFFYNHQELLPNNTFCIGADGYWVHKYDHPHCTDEQGNNNCPYCLSRTHNKGTPKEKTHWVHIFVTFTLITKAFTIPIYVYPLKAKQINSEQSDEKLKQECELLGTQEVLPKIRKKYPRLNITFLGDALYANKPFIELCNRLKIDYAIVLKDNLKKVNKKCDELATHPLYQNSYSLKTQEEEVSWFNGIGIDVNVQTNVLRYKEKKPQGYNGQWIVSKSISKKNCLKLAEMGRVRWKHEDVHNTCKNRGFEIKHDMARASPNLLIVWKLITFVAFSLFEIFRCTTLAIIHKKSRSFMRFARDMLSQLINKTWAVIKSSPILTQQKVQFRFHFRSGP